MSNVVSVHSGQWSRQPAYRRDYQRSQRDIKRARGICVTSGCNLQTGGFFRCRQCRIEHAAYCAERRARETGAKP
jgi:hypothetical protein